MRDTVGGVARPVTLEREHSMRFADRGDLTRTGSRVDCAMRLLRRLPLMTEPRVHVREPERVRGGEGEIAQTDEPRVKGQ